MFGGPHAGRGPRGYTRSDDRIREDVCDRLCEHGYIDASDVEVRVTAGEVTLEGSVRGRQQKRMAEDVTGQVTPEANVAGRVARGAPMSARQASNAGDRSAPAFSRAGSKSV